MANYTKDTVSVQVFSSTRPISTKGLSIPLVVIPHNLTLNRLDSFSSLNSVLQAGAATNSPLAKFAEGCFSGTVDIMKVARANLKHIELEIANLIPVGEEISLNVNVGTLSKKVSYTRVEEDAAKTEVAEKLTLALEAAFSSMSDAVEFTSTGKIITFANKSGDTTPISAGWASTTGNLADVLVKDITEDVLDNVITEAMSQDSDVFFLMSEDHSEDNIVALHSFASANKMMYITSTADAKCKDSSDTDNVGFNLSELSAEAVSLSYFSSADGHFPEAAIVGAMAGIKPYNVNSLNLKTLSGIPIDYFSEQERITLTSRNVNYYHKEHGLGVLKEGWMSDGNFFDTARFKLWSEFTVKESVFSAMKRLSDAGSAYAYTDDSALALESVIRNDYINVGIRGGTILTGNSIDEETGSTVNLDPIVNFGTRAQQTNANIANRIWDDVLIELVYSGSIHHIKIDIGVLLNRNPS